MPRYCAHLRQLLQRSGNPAGATATAERGRLAKAKADLAETKHAVLRGDLVEALAVEREWSDILRSVRAAMLALPSRVAQRLPHLTPHDILQLDAEVRAALVDMGSGNTECLSQKQNDASLAKSKR